jgi:hypothetical protein
MQVASFGENTANEILSFRFHKRGLIDATLVAKVASHHDPPEIA